MSKARDIANLLSTDGDGTIATAPRIISQTTLPTSNFKLGDVWYDTNDDEMSICISVDGNLQWKEI
jgi:hypothetical protein